MAESVVTDDDAQLRRALWAMSSGLYLLSLTDGDRSHLMTISLVMQVSKEPRMLAMSVEREALALEFLRQGAVVGLVFLDVTQAPLARKFAKPPAVDVAAMTASGIPVVRDEASRLLLPRDALGMVLGRVVAMVELGSHWLITSSVDSMVVRQPVEAWSTVLSMSDTRMHYGG
ncbi:MAG: flavin reductase family protein [Ferrimicrobium sp.]